MVLFTEVVRNELLIVYDSRILPGHYFSGFTPPFSLPGPQAPEFNRSFLLFIFPQRIPCVYYPSGNPVCYLKLLPVLV